MIAAEQTRIRDRMHAAGRDAFNAGRPCVPGLDVLWAREIAGLPTRHGWAELTARWWRFGWNQAADTAYRAQPERLYGRCPDVEFDGFTFFDCVGATGHEGDCRGSL